MYPSGLLAAARTTFLGRPPNQSSRAATLPRRLKHQAPAARDLFACDAGINGSHSKKNFNALLSQSRVIAKLLYYYRLLTPQ